MNYPTNNSGRELPSNIYPSISSSYSMPNEQQNNQRQTTTNAVPNFNVQANYHQQNNIDHQYGVAHMNQQNQNFQNGYQQCNPYKNQTKVDKAQNYTVHYQSPQNNQVSYQQQQNVAYQQQNNQVTYQKQQNNQSDYQQQQKQNNQIVYPQLQNSPYQQQQNNQTTHQKQQNNQSDYQQQQQQQNNQISYPQLQNSPYQQQQNNQMAYQQQQNNQILYQQQQNNQMAYQQQNNHNLQPNYQKPYVLQEQPKFISEMPRKTIDMGKYEEYAIDLNDYITKSKLGKGTFGVVKFAINKYTGWEVAIKELISGNLPEKELLSFKREIEILLRCKGPFLLNFTGYSITPKLTIVTDFMKGGSLWSLLHDHPGSLNPTQKTFIAIGIAHGMKYLHRQGILHRDLKSPNILLDEHLLPKIADFGLGKFINEIGNEPVPMTGSTGTPNWMAPEQIISQNYSFPVDVFAYGVILYELISGKCPFAEFGNSIQITNAICNGRRPELPNEIIGTPLGNLIFRCWDQYPEGRPTFDEIYMEFVERKVEFPGSNSNSIKSFFHFISQKDIHEEMIIPSNLMNKIILNRRNNEVQKNLLPLLCKFACEGKIEDFIALFSCSPVESLLNINNIDSTGQTPLHYAVHSGQVSMVSFLLSIEGIDVNSTEKNGNTPLSLAVQKSNKHIVNALLSHPKIDVNKPNKFGLTPLHYGVINNNGEIVKNLIQFSKTNLLSKDQNGYTAYDIAEKYKYSDLAYMIQSALQHKNIYH